MFFSPLGKKLAELESHFEKMIFRRVTHVNANSRDLEYVSYDNGTDDDFVAFFGPQEAPTFTPEEIEHNVEYCYSRYSFETSDKAPLPNDNHRGAITGFRDGRCDLDPVTFEIVEFSEKNDSRTKVPPRIGDLVCGYVKPGFYANGRFIKPRFEKWFIASEQLYRLWLAFIKGIDTESFQCYKNLMRGNKLCTSNYRKWLMAHGDNGEQVDGNEVPRRFFRLRTESPAVNYVHIYTAFVLLFCYGVVPNNKLVPMNLNDDLSMQSWDLPEDWIANMIQHYC